MRFIFLVLFLVSCSSRNDKSSSYTSKVDPKAFQKTKPLTNAQIPDFYKSDAAIMNPALSAETLDRHTMKELSALETNTDVLMQISVLCSKNDFDNAFLLASQNFNLYQKVAAFWNQLGNCHLNQGSHRKALLFYNKAIEVIPNYVPALNNIGVMYVRQGQHQKALLAFERANAQSKFSKTPRYNLAKMYLTYGLVDQSLPLLSSLLNESPTDVDLLNALAVANFMKGNLEKALSTFEQIPREQWSRAEVGLNLAYTLKSLGRSKEALDVFNNVQKPRSGDLKNYYSILRNQLGETE
jgi:Flp pilus assembly protein TadD